VSNAGLADDWQGLVDPTALRRWMDARKLGSGPIENVRPLGGGTQNVLLRFDRAGESYVLRRPPLHKRPESDEVMRREMRVLAALAGTDVPHPELIAGETDTGPLGAVFYLMRPVEGFNPSLGLPELHASRPDWRRSMGEAMVDGLVALAGVDADASGLGDLGHAGDWLARQVPRWRRQLDGYAAQPGWTGVDALPPVDPICAWLEAHRPDAFRPGLLHGDYHLANVLFRPDAPALAAIVDWELASIGDPLLDLGWLTATWPDEPFEAIVPVTPWEGFPSAAEITDRYCAATGRASADAHWFGILACFKLGVLLEGTHARACAGLAARATGDRLHARAIALFDRALHRIQQGPTDGFRL
jgi:aminoglycoside phosphotransferase (APT) family kinase protein